MRKWGLKKYLLTVLFGVFLLQIKVFADVDVLNISQIIQQGNDVYLYVNALDSEGRAMEESLSAEQLSVNMDEEQAISVLDSQNYQSLGMGTSYIFCIDISKSVTDEEMQEIRNSMTDFVNSMGENDYARIITIGSEITSVCDSTSDKNVLNDTIQQIDRDANDTFLYKGLSYALDGQRKKTENIPARAAIILFTDGMDDSDGAYSVDQVVADFASARVPIYVVGMKGNDPEANLKSVGQIAQQSGGYLYSYSDMSITEAVQNIGNVMRSSYQVHVQPPLENFGKRDIRWQITYNSGNYTVDSKKYVYSLGLDNVLFPTPEPTETPIPTVTPEPTATPEPSPAPTMTPVPTSTPTPTPEPEKTHLETIRLFLEENMIICIAAGMIFIALVIIIVILVKRNKEKGEEFEAEYLERNGTGGNYEETLADDVGQDNDYYHRGESGDLEDEETIGLPDDGYDDDDDETIAADVDEGVQIQFEIIAEGKSETVVRTLKNEIILGRGTECDLDVSQNLPAESRKQTSRKHAYIVQRPDGIYVRDNSRNKTYLNGVEVTGEMVLRDRDVLQMGKAIVKVNFLNC